MTTRSRRAVLALLAPLMLIAGCSYANTGPDEFACAYGGGPFEAQTQKATFQPGSGRDFVGMMDTIVELPANVRNYIIDRSTEEGDVVGGEDYITAVTGDGIELEYEISVRFRYNTEIGCEFWEEHGKRFDVDTDDGWREFLAQNIRPIFEASVKAATQDFDDWEPIWRNEPVDIGDDQTERAWIIIQEDVGSAMVTEVNRALGADYFCGVTWSIENADVCPPFEVLIKSVVPERESLTDRYGQVAEEQAEAERVRAEQARENTRISLSAQNEALEQEERLQRELDLAQAQVEIAEQRRLAAVIDAQATAAECFALAEEDIDCTLLEAARNGSIDFWVIGEGGSAPQIVRPAGDE